MTFDIITIFPDIFESYFSESIIKRAQKKKLIKVNIINLRDFTVNKHKTVDDRPFGGGAGMIIKLEPIFKAVSSLIKLKTQSSKLRKKTKIILFTPRGKKLNQKIVYQLSKLDRLILICGHYEGVDERVAKHIVDEEISIGDYILTGGELPAMVMVDAVTRLIPGVIKKESLLEESFHVPRSTPQSYSSLEYPQYTRPEIFSPKPGIKWRVPKVLLSGNHKKIEEWRKKHRKVVEK